MQSVMVIGSSGSGKSTLAKQLGEITKLPIVHIDKIYWKPGWDLRPAEETMEMVRAEANKNQWIFDGNNTGTFKYRISRADTLIFLDFPTYLCIYRVICRLIKYKLGYPRTDMAEGCPERFDWEFIKFLVWIYNYKKDGRWQRAIKLYEEAPSHIAKYHLQNRQSVEVFLRKINTN